MKERILITYYIQNKDHDNSKNCYFMVVDNPSKVKVREVMDQFPPRLKNEHGNRAYHLRFLDCFGGKNAFYIIHRR